MKGFKRKMLVSSFACAMVLGALTAPAAFAEEGAAGGWTEGEGYWASNDGAEVGIFSTPDLHQGWKEFNDDTRKGLESIIIPAHVWKVG